MMKNMIFVLACLLATFSCKKDNKEYSGATLVEFTKNAVSSTIAFSESGEQSVKMPLQIVGTASGNDRKVVLRLSKDDSRFKLKSTEVVIRANEYTAEAELVLLAGNFAEGDETEISVIIDETSDLKPSENYRNCDVTVSKQAFLDVFVGKFKCEEKVNQDTYYTNFIAGSTSNTIRNTNFWNFAPQGQYVTYTILKENYSVVINKQSWTDMSGQTYTVSGSGTYDLSGKMTVDYVIEISDTVYEKGTHVFTPVD